MLSFIIIIILVALTGIVTSYVSERSSDSELFDSSSKRRIKTPQVYRNMNEHHELSWKLTNKGSNTSNLKTAKECLYELTSSYERIKQYANANDRSCYEDDIEDVRLNAEGLAEEKWRKKADTFLFEIEKAYEAISCYDFQTIETAYKSKNILLKAYDNLFDWTRKCYEENKDIWKTINIWNDAKEKVKWLLEQYDHHVVWNNNNLSVRQQIIAELDKRIEVIRPEYQRKMQLRSLIVQKIANQGAMQRSHLLKAVFDGFVLEEVKACYRGLVKEHTVIEYKQGSVYFVVLSDAAAKKHPPQKTNQDPPKEKARPAETNVTPKESKASDSKGNLSYKELIHRFNQDGIEYVDKTINGGSLYFFTEDAANLATELGYKVAYAPNGTKGTGHRPAWYARLPR